MALDEIVGERKHVTVLFADIVDSTRLISTMDAEDAAGILSTTVHQIEVSIRDFGGTVVQRMGDGILAVFGAPIAIEEHAIHACHAALGMQKTMEALAVALERSSPLAIRVGINTGVVVVRNEGQGATNKMDLTGFPVHLASRLEGIAEPGAICISETTYSLVRDAFDCTSLGSRQVKGVDEPVTVYGLRGSRSTWGRQVGPQEFKVDSPFVGRPEELRVLQNLVKQLASGEGSIIGIWGDAGVGKSRLTAEVRQTVVTPAMRWLECAGLSFGQSINHLPLIQLVRSCIGATENDPEAVTWSRLEHHIREQFAEESDDILPYLAIFMGLDTRREFSGKLDFLDGDAIGLQIRRSLRLFFQRLSWRSPLILVFEDFYWFDDSSAKLVEHLLPLAEKEAILICLIGRGEVDSPEDDLRTRAHVNHSAQYHNLTLSPLPPSESMTLASQLLSVDDGLLRLRQIILEKAEGNPLFIQETVRSLLDTGILVRSPNTAKLRLTTAIETVRIPDTIHDIVTARIDRLDSEVKQLLLLASVIGRTFLYRVLRAIDEEVERLDDRLTTLRRFELIEEHKSSPELEYIFGHAVIQEVTYTGMLRTRRQQLHKLVGEALERLEGNAVDEMSGVLAYHFGQAEIWPKAQRYLLAAGERADRLAANSEALHHYRQCFRAFGDRIDPLLQASMERKLGEAHYRRGEHEEATRYFHGALARLGPVKFNVDGDVKLPIVRELATQLVHLVRRLCVSPKIQKTSAEVPDEIEIIRMLGWMAYFSNPKRLLLYTFMMLNASERRLDPYGIGLSTTSVAFVCDVFGLRRVAKNYLVYGDGAADRASNPLVKATVESIKGWHNFYVGTWDQAKEHFANGAMMGREAGDIRAWGAASWGNFLLSFHTGNFANAWDFARQMMVNAEETGDRLNLRWGRLAQGMILSRLDRLGTAESELTFAYEMARETPDYQLLPHAAAEMGLCLLRQARPGEAEAVLAEATSIVRTIGLRGHHVAALLNMVAELRLTEAALKAGSDRRSAMRRAQRSCRVALRGGKIFSGAAPQAFRSMAEYFWLQDKAEKANGFWQQSLDTADRLGARYETALTQCSMGRFTGDPTIREMGETLLQEIKSVSLV